MKCLESESESESEVAQSCPTLCDLWTLAHKVPPSMGFSRQEYWSGLPFPSPGDLPNPGIKPRSPTLQADALTSAPPGKPWTMCELDHKEGWAPKNWCFQAAVLEKTLESPLDCKEIQPVNPKGNQPWIFIGRTDTEAEGLILWPPDVKSWLIGKEPDAGKDWGKEDKGTTEDQMVGWHHWLYGHESEQILVKDREDWPASVHGVAKSQTWLSDGPTSPPPRLFRRT